MPTLRPCIASGVILVVVLGLASPGSTLDPPAFTEVQTLWTNFWTRMAADDVRGATSLLHPLVQVRFPGQRTLDEWREVALQMAFCRLEDAPVPAARDAYAYPLHCRHGDETALSAVIVRYENGAWRLLQP